MVLLIALIIATEEGFPQMLEAVNNKYKTQFTQQELQNKTISANRIRGILIDFIDFIVKMGKLVKDSPDHVANIRAIDYYCQNKLQPVNSLETFVTKLYTGTLFKEIIEILKVILKDQGSEVPLESYNYSEIKVARAVEEYHKKH